MEVHDTTLVKDNLSQEEIAEREAIDDLILQNQTMDALIKGLTGDIEIFKNDKEGKWTPADIVRFTMQLNIMRDKKSRNLAAINLIIKRQKLQSISNNTYNE